MKLQTYLDKSGTSRANFALQVGVTTEAVRLWVRGQRMPDRESMEKIRVATNGQVAPNDFYDRTVAA